LKPLGISLYNVDDFCAFAAFFVAVIVDVVEIQDDWICFATSTTASAQGCEGP